MKRRIIPVLVALALIVVIGAIAINDGLLEQFFYSDDRVDLRAYFGVSEDRLAIVLQDEILEDQALLRDGVCYFSQETVRKYFTDDLYANLSEGVVLYTSPAVTLSVQVGSTVQEEIPCQAAEAPSNRDLGYAAVVREGDELYYAADYLKQFANFTADVYDYHVQVYTQWGVKQVDAVNRDTAARLNADAKSPILCDLAKGDPVEVLEVAQDWSRIKTADSLIGYVENKRLEHVSKSEAETQQEEAVTDYVEPQQAFLSLGGKVCLGWHSMGNASGNESLEDLAAGAPCMNVVAPTWFSLNDNMGGFRSLASQDYVERAHAMGLKVWGVLDDFNYQNETPEANIDLLAVLSSSTSRRALIDGIMSTAAQLGLDGINIDFEMVSEDCGEHFAQFLRELSQQSHQAGLTLSVDDYVPYSYRSYYRMDVQGKVVDYVIIMGYDEHWAGGDEAGSVASIEFVGDGIRLGLADVPAEKLVNALPFYWRVWKTDDTGLSSEALRIRDVEDYVESHDITPVWDEATCQNYAEWTEGDTFCQAWLEDADSIAVKLNLMSMNEIGGVAVWRLGYGNAEVWSLIEDYLK